MVVYSYCEDETIAHFQEGCLFAPFCTDHSLLKEKADDPGGTSAAART